MALRFRACKAVGDFGRSWPRASRAEESDVSFQPLFLSTSLKPAVQSEQYIGSIFRDLGVPHAKKLR